MAGRGFGAAADGGQVLGDNFVMGAALLPRALVPGHVGEQDAHAALVKIRHHLFDPRDAAGHIAEAIELVAVVDADVRVYRPDEHSVDPAVALLQIVKVSIHGVSSRHRIVEVAVLHHHLRLDETALRPLQFGAIILGAGILHSAQALLFPMAQRRQPRGPGRRARGSP